MKNNNPNNPLVSIIMPVYNGEKFLRGAIESILKQTYKNFEFIIINDGSKDNSLKIIEKYAYSDNRIFIISRENRGLSYSLNEGISLAKGKFIARMDADDISLPSRIERQVEIMRKYPNVDVVGCDYKIVDRYSNLIKLIKVPKKNEDIFLSLCYGVPFAHPSVMIRKSVFLKFKYENSSVEDYLLWTKIFNFKNFYNIHDCLFLYRYHYGHSYSDSKRLLMLKEELKISRKFISDHFSKIKKILEQKRNSFAGRALANIFFLYSKKETVKILNDNPKLFLYFLYFLIRHHCRWYYWKIKSF